MWLTGCNNTLNLNTADSVSPKIDKNLPTINEKFIRNIPDMDAIALEWAAITDSNTYGYHIYRTNVAEFLHNLKRIATIKNRYTSHYVDTDLTPQTQYLYSISVIGANKTESRASRAKKISTRPIFDSVSLISSVGNLPRQVKVIWRPHSNQAVNAYILERRSPINIKWKKIATIKGRLNSEYMDIDLKDNLSYTYRLKARTFKNIKSKYSKMTKATTRPLPSGIRKLHATNNQVKNITISWEPSISKDILGYNLYASNYSQKSFKKIAYIKKEKNTYSHRIKEDNKVKYYKMTSVDKDYLETNQKYIPVAQGKTLSKPRVPKITLAMKKGDNVILNWNQGDNRTIQYTVYKTIKNSLFKTKLKIYKNIKETRFVDENIPKGSTYTYEIQSIDKYGLTSKKVKALTLKLKKEK
jgi:fibronectin type 3 domain-containing protein